jgi:hypothetical protein
MMRVAQAGGRPFAVSVAETAPKLVRQGMPQYVAVIPSSLLPPGGGDTIEEAVDDVAQWVL